MMYVYGGPLNPWANAGQLRTNPIGPTIGTGLSDSLCASAFATFQSVNGSEYATRDAALRGFYAATDTDTACRAWATRQLAAVGGSTSSSTPTDADCARAYLAFVSAFPGQGHPQFRALHPECNAWSVTEELRVGGVTTRTTVPQSSDEDCAVRFNNHLSLQAAGTTRTAALASFSVASPDCKDWSDAQTALLAGLPAGAAPRAPSSGGSLAVVIGVAVLALLASGGKSKF